MKGRRRGSNWKAHKLRFFRCDACNVSRIFLQKTQLFRLRNLCKATILPVAFYLNFTQILHFRYWQRLFDVIGLTYSNSLSIPSSRTWQTKRIFSYSRMTWNFYICCGRMNPQLLPALYCGVKRLRRTFGTIAYGARTRQQRDERWRILTT